MACQNNCYSFSNLFTKSPHFTHYPTLITELLYYIQKCYIVSTIPTVLWKMHNMTRLTSVQQECTIAIIQKGISTRAISQKFGCNQTTIIKLAKHRRQSIRDRKSPRREHVTTPRLIRKIKLND